MFKFIKKFFNKLFSFRKSTLYYNLDNYEKRITNKIKNIVSNDYVSNLISYIAKFFLTTYKSFVYVFGLGARSFRYRMMFGWFVLIIIFIVVVTFVIKSFIYIRNNRSSFFNVDNSNNYAALNFKYDRNSLINNYYNGDYNKHPIDNNTLSSLAKTAVQNEVKGTLGLSNSIQKLTNNSTSKTYTDSDFTFTPKNNNIIQVSGDPDAINALLDVEKQYVSNGVYGNHIISFTDAYGRPMFYGEGLATNKNSSKALMDPTKIMNSSYVIQTVSDQNVQDNTLNGKSLWEISDNGKYWGKELKGTVFSSISTAASPNSLFDNPTFTLSSDGFFTAFTKYINVMLSNFQFHNFIVDKLDEHHNDVDINSHYVSNAIPNSKQAEDNNYIKSVQNFFPILIWMNHDQIFTTTKNIISNNNIQYTFHWANNSVGQAFKAEADAYIKIHANFGNLDEETDLDPSGNYWYYKPGSSQYASGFTSNSDIVVNFLDFGFDHLRQFSFTPGDDNPSHAPLADEINKYVSQSWYQTKLLPFKDNDGITPEASYVNPNYNQLHIFFPNTENKNTPTSKWFSLAYGLTDDSQNGKFQDYNPISGDLNKIAKSKSDWSKNGQAYPFRITLDNKIGPYKSPVGKISINGKDNSEIDHVILNSSTDYFNSLKSISNDSGLLGVINVNSSFDDKAGLSSINFKNDPDKDVSDDNKLHIYYKTANFAIVMPHSSNNTYKKLPVPNPNIKQLPVSMFYVNNLTTSILPNFLFTNDIYYLQTYISYARIIIATLVFISVILLFFAIYVFVRFKLLGWFIFLLGILFIGLQIIFIAYNGIQINYANLVVIGVGLMLFTLAIEICYKFFRQQTYKLFNKVKDNLLLSKGSLLLFLSYFIGVFIISVTLSSRIGNNILGDAFQLFSIIIIFLIFLVAAFFIFFLQTIATHKKFSRIDRLVTKALKLKFFNKNEVNLLKLGVLKDDISRDEMIKNLLKINKLYVVNDNIDSIRALSNKKKFSLPMNKQLSTPLNNNLISSINLDINEKVEKTFLNEESPKPLAILDSIKKVKNKLTNKKSTQHQNEQKLIKNKSISINILSKSPAKEELKVKTKKHKKLSLIDKK